MANKYAFSIIIPHYNIPHLLRRCLISIPKRNDLQIIVVDDKSSCENIEKLKELEREFDYVSFIYSNINGGGGRARNIGLSYAKGTYVLFADGDDYFNYCIQEILDEYSQKEYDAIYFNNNIIDTDTYLPTHRNTTLVSAIKMYEKDGNLDAFRYIFGEPWCKMIKRQIIEENHIRFDEYPIHNDTKYSYLTGYYAQNIKYDNRALYCLADRSGSVSKSPDDDKLLIRTKVFAEKNRFLKEHGISIFDQLMISPFWIYANRRDKRNFGKCLSVVQNYGFSKGFIFRKVAARFFFGLKMKIRNGLKNTFCN